MASARHRRTLPIALGLAAATLCGGPRAAATAADADRWPVDVFASAASDRWTPIRSPRGVRLAVARLSATRDVALVTWEEFGQVWCGLAIPESDCKGGRWLVIVGRPGALPERFARKAPIDSAVPIAIATDSRRSVRETAMDMTLGVYIRGGADLPVGRHVHAFQFSVDYEKLPGFARGLRHCRTISVLVAGRRYLFGCAGLRTAEASD